MRSSSGIYLVETLVALLVGSMMMLALSALFLQTLRATTTASNQFTADQIGQSIVEEIHAGAVVPAGPNTDFSVSGFVGTTLVTPSLSPDGTFTSYIIQVSWPDPSTAKFRTSTYSTVVFTP